MRRSQLAGGLLVVLVAACGGAADAPRVHLTATQALGDATEVSLLVFGSRAVCSELLADLPGALSLPTCAEGAYDGDAVCRISSTRQVLSEIGEAIRLWVPVGQRSFLGVGYDDSGTIVGAGCTGPVAVEEGATADVDVRIE